MTVAPGFPFLWSGSFFRRLDTYSSGLIVKGPLARALAACLADLYPVSRSRLWDLAEDPSNGVLLLKAKAKGSAGGVGHSAQGGSGETGLHGGGDTELGRGEVGARQARRGARLSQERKLRQERARGS